MSATPPVLDRHVLASLQSAACSASVRAGHGKQFATLRARLAIRGRELHAIRKGDQAFYEVRHNGQARTCGTVHDVEGLIAQIDSARAT